MPEEISSEKLLGAIDTLIKNPELLKSMMALFSGTLGGTPSGEHESATASPTDESPAKPAGAKVDRPARALSNSAKNVATQAEGAPEVLPKSAVENGSDDLGGALGGILSNPALMAKLPEVVSTIAPMLSAPTSEASASGAKLKKGPPHDKRLTLLVALKPYLSRERCDAIDYILKINQLGTLFKSFNG